MPPDQMIRYTTKAVCAAACRALSNLGVVACDRGQFASATPLFEESLAILRELDDQWGISIALGNLNRRVSTIVVHDNDFIAE